MISFERKVNEVSHRLEVVAMLKALVYIYSPDIDCPSLSNYYTIK